MTAALAVLLAVTLATVNAPTHLGRDAQRVSVERVRSHGASLVALQEFSDKAAWSLRSRSLGCARSRAESSAAVCWERDTWRHVKRGRYKVSSPDAHAPRHVVWVVLEHRATGERVRFGSVHLVALFRSRELTARARAYREREHAHQVARVARWLDAGPRRVLGCDCQRAPSSVELQPLRAVAQHHTPAVGTFGRAQLDSLWTASGVLRRARAVTIPSDHDALVARLRR